ncbi:MAG: GlsB/YeaQ/YmgE family stress response membrane protein [Bacteroidetes bacterium]|nr:MAG: GlsB/YeaQ/YmgE family stress response membrane protein [Bacteroidota bacterium]
MDLLYYILIGIASGFIAGQLIKGRGFGVVGNLIVGVIGAVIGGWIFRSLGFYAGRGIVPSLITSVLGSVVLLYVVNLIRRF